MTLIHKFNIGDSVNHYQGMTGKIHNIRYVDNRPHPAFILYTVLYENNVDSDNIFFYGSENELELVPEKKENIVFHWGDTYFEVIVISDTIENARKKALADLDRYDNVEIPNLIKNGVPVMTHISDFVFIRDKDY